MKNALQYYYQIETEDIRQIGRQYFFRQEGYQYALIPYYNGNEIEGVYKAHLELLRHHIYCHQIILNRDKQILTVINDIPYVLMKIYVAPKPITIEDIQFLENIPLNIQEKNTLVRDQWALLWGEKVDYFEYELTQIGKRYPLMRESFSYFAGLTETAIQLVRNAKVPGNANYVLSHKRVRFKDTLLHLYNPLNIVLDVKVRDISEYYKDLFFHNYDIWDDLQSYFQKTPLSQYEYILFFARMMYPSYYFDAFEKITIEKEEESILKPILEKTIGYEQLLKQLYQYLRQYTKMPEIEWLLKT